MKRQRRPFVDLFVGGFLFARLLFAAAQVLPQSFREPGLFFFGLQLFHWFFIVFNIIHGPQGAAVRRKIQQENARVAWRP